MTDLNYQPPGVFVDENASPVPEVSSTVAIPPARVALVGPGTGYQTATETIQLGAGPVSLTHKGIDTDTIVVTSLDGIVYEVVVDFTVSVTGTDEESITSITRVSGGSIPLDGIVTVASQYTDSAYYEPFLSSDWDLVQSRFGQAVARDGTVQSPLSLAAKIVFEQNAPEIVCVPTRGSTPLAVTADQLKAAMAKLAPREDIGIVVPLPIGISGTDGDPGDTNTVCTDLKNHVENTTNEGGRRIGIIGLDSGATRSHDALAQLIDSSRVVLAWPNVLKWYNGFTNTYLELGGCYLAAAYAGVLAVQPPQNPLTMRYVRSLGPIPSRIVSSMSRQYKNTLSGNGVAVTEQKPDGRLIVRHGVSTNMSSVLTREVSIVRARDAMLGVVEASLESSGLVSLPIGATTTVSVRGVVEGALEFCVSQGLIVEHSNLATRISTTDPTVIEVKFAYKPAYPLNRITVSFSVNTVTGTFSEQAV